MAFTWYKNGHIKANLIVFIGKIDDTSEKDKLKLYWYVRDEIETEKIFLGRSQNIGKRWGKKIELPFQKNK